MRKAKHSLQKTFGLSWVPRVPEYASGNLCASFVLRFDKRLPDVGGVCPVVT